MAAKFAAMEQRAEHQRLKDTVVEAARADLMSESIVSLPQEELIAQPFTLFWNLNRSMV